MQFVKVIFQLPINSGTYHVGLHLRHHMRSLLAQLLQNISLPGASLELALNYLF